MNRTLRWIGIAFGALVAIGTVAYAAIYVVSERAIEHAYPFNPVAIAIPTDAEAVAEGRRLAQIHLCGDCHGKNGEGRVLFDDPLIAHIVAPDLTSAAARYSAAEFAAVVRSGVRPNGRSMVVMPSEVLRLLSEDDLGKIIAYLKSLPPAAGVAPGIRLGPLARLGIVVGQYKTTAVLVAEAVAPAEAGGERAAAGHYLASTICAGCHGAALGGAPAGPDMPATPPLQIVAAYTPEAFTDLMRKGVALGDRQLGVMRETALVALSGFTDGEIADLYTYLHDLPVAAQPKSP